MMAIEKFFITVFVLFLVNEGTAFRFNYTCEGNLNISCGTKPIILISVMSVTRPNWPCSLAGSGDRNNRKEGAVWRKCSGRTSCTIKSGMKLADYKYLGIHYDCGKSYDMCSSVRIRSNKAYLESPNYRQVFPYAGSTTCRCKAKLTAQTRIVVGVQYKQFSSIDTHLMIKWRPEEIVQIYEETDLSPGVIYRKQANQTFVIMFNANGRNGTGFFQLFYKASSPITMICNMDLPIEPTTPAVTTSIQIPPSITYTNTTAPLVLSTTTTTSPTTTARTTSTTSTTTTTTSTTQPPVRSETVRTMNFLTTTEKNDKMSTDSSTSTRATTTIASVPSTITTELTATTSVTRDEESMHWTEVPRLGRVVHTEYSTEVFGILLPALIGISILVAVSCLIFLLVLLLISRKRKKYYLRQTSKEHRPVSRSVYELEHPVPGEEETGKPGNGVVEESAPPSVDFENEDMKKEVSRTGCSLSDQSVDSDFEKPKYTESVESLVVHDNPLHEEMDEVEEVAPGSLSLYATIDKGQMMWLRGQQPEDDKDVDKDFGPMTLERGPSLTFGEGETEHMMTLKTDLLIDGQIFNSGDCQKMLANCDLFPTSGSDVGAREHEGQSVTLNEGHILIQKEGDSKIGNADRGQLKDDVDVDFEAKISSTQGRDSDPDSNIAEYAQVEKNNTRIENQEDSCKVPSDHDSGDMLTEFVLVNDDPDYEQINYQSDDDLDLPPPPPLPPGGASNQVAPYMTVDVTNLWKQEVAGRHIYDEV